MGQRGPRGRTSPAAGRREGEGGTRAYTFVPLRKILLLECGSYLPLAVDNRNPEPVLVDGRHGLPIRHDPDGKPVQPQVHHFVDGKGVPRSFTRRLANSCEAVGLRAAEPVEHGNNEGTTRASASHRPG